MAEQVNLVPTNGNVNGQEVAALFDPSLTEALSSEERALLCAMLSQDERIDVAIPEDTAVEDLWRALSLCCKVLVRVNKAGDLLKLLVGRALILIADYPETWQSRGFSSLDKFMSSDQDNGLPKITGISRNELYKAKGVAESFPSISMREYREIGINKLAVISKVVKEGDSNTQEWLEVAKTDTMVQLKERIYRSDNQIPEGSLDFDILTLPMKRDTKKIIVDFCDSPKYSAICGTNDAGQKLVWAIIEAQTEWAAQEES